MPKDFSWSGAFPFLDFLLTPLPYGVSHVEKIKDLLFYPPIRFIQPVPFFPIPHDQLAVVKLIPIEYCQKKFLSVQCQTCPFEIENFKNIPVHPSFWKISLNPRFKWPLLTIQVFGKAQSFWKKKFPIGQPLFVLGKVKYWNRKFFMGHPQQIWTSQPSVQIFEKKAIYFGKVDQTLVKRVLQKGNDLLAASGTDLPEWIPSSLLKEKHWPSWWQAIYQLHHPQTQLSFSLFDTARQRLVFDELVAHFILEQRKALQKGKNPAVSLPKTEPLNHLIQTLPFELTHSQKVALQEIQEDLQKKEQMIRLLQGDVGSGKTIVALLAAAQAIFAGFQVSFLAPTELLAKQHFQSAKKLFESKINIAFHTGKLSSHSKNQTLNQLDEIDLLIGTHAVFQEKILLPRLALSIIDEQQRFGVEQRLKMVQQNQNSPHVLSLSATPIPRTLFQSRLGGISVSNLQEKPKNRTKIETRIMPLTKIPDILDGIKRALSRQEQVYWVCPLVDEVSSAFSKLTPAQKRFDFLNQHFPGKIALVHGQQDQKTQQQNMEAFIHGICPVLVATTIIEIGIDVPKATVMIIEHADRFGLSQLHQLRGRVGRSDLPSFCLLLYDTELSDIAKERLLSLRRFDDGFKIADIDLLLRGTGEIFGIKQSGAMSLKVLKSLSFKPDAQGISEFDIYVSLSNLAANFAQSIAGIPQANLLLTLYCGT